MDDLNRHRFWLNIITPTPCPYVHPLLYTCKINKYTVESTIYAALPVHVGVYIHTVKSGMDLLHRIILYSKSWRSNILLY